MGRDENPDRQRDGRLPHPRRVCHTSVPTGSLKARDRDVCTASSTQRVRREAECVTTGPQQPLPALKSQPVLTAQSIFHVPCPPVLSSRTDRRIKEKTQTQVFTVRESPSQPERKGKRGRRDYDLEAVSAQPQELLGRARQAQVARAGTDMGLSTSRSRHAAHAPRSLSWGGSTKNTSGRPCWLRKRRQPGKRRASWPFWTGGLGPDGRRQEPLAV